MDFTGVGFRFRGKTPDCLLEDGFINLAPEDDNKHDPNAVKIIKDGEHVGYVSRSQNIAIREILENHELYRIEVLEVFPASVFMRIHWK